MLQAKQLIISAFLSMFLFGCGGGEPYLLTPQHYLDMEILVEIRPGAPTIGMNEFLVMATHENRLPAANYIVSIKLKTETQWHQSIQDGATGVYRRAIRVNDPRNDILVVQLQDKDTDEPAKELLFPLSQKYR